MPIFETVVSDIDRSFPLSILRHTHPQRSQPQRWMRYLAKASDLISVIHGRKTPVSPVFIRKYSLTAILSNGKKEIASRLRPVAVLSSRSPEPPLCSPETDVLTMSAQYDDLDAQRAIQRRVMADG